MDLACLTYDPFIVVDLDAATVADIKSLAKVVALCRQTMPLPGYDPDAPAGAVSAPGDSTFGHILYGENRSAGAPSRALRTKSNRPLRSYRTEIGPATSCAAGPRSWGEYGSGCAVHGVLSLAFWSAQSGGGEGRWTALPNAFGPSQAMRCVWLLHPLELDVPGFGTFAAGSDNIQRKGIRTFHFAEAEGIGVTGSIEGHTVFIEDA